MTLFQKFDVDKSGYITRANLLEAMNKLEHKITSEEIDIIMKKHSNKNKEGISFEQFKSIFENPN